MTFAEPLPALLLPLLLPTLQEGLMARGLFAQQTTVQPHMRKVLLEWLFELVDEFSM